jgi:protocatechuate 3,4-dioxygenase beta subunit
MSKRPVLTYQGRPLAKPDEELVDQGLAFDLGTLVSRRSALRVFGLGATAVGLAACGGSSGTSSATTTAGASPASPTAAASAASATSAATATAAAPTTLTKIPQETAGPFPGDGSNGPDALAQSRIVRSDIRSSIGSASGTAAGVPMTLELVIRNLAKGGSAYQGAAVYVWHCDREGRYSMYSNGVTDENYLRGVQVAGADGTVRFTSIFPACYSGRWPHIHFEVYPDAASISNASKAIVTSQVALPHDTCAAVYTTAGYEQSVSNLSQVSLQSDMVFSDDGARSQLPTVSGNAKSGYTVTLVVGV